MSHTAFVLHIPPNCEVVEVMRTLEMRRSLSERLNLLWTSSPLLLVHHVFLSARIKIHVLPEWVGVVGLRFGGRLILGGEGFEKGTIRLWGDEEVGREKIGVFPTVARPGCMSAYSG